MIQEKDFLYRVPVKTAPITTPRGQIRNPEILVDVEGGEFMHGNILDANSTNKLINQSVKDAVDDKFIESGLQAAIATKADASALTNEVNRATSAENGLQAAISAKADASALSNYVLTTALNQQIDTLNTAISAKQDKPDDGNMFFQVEHDSVSGWFKQKGELKFTHDDNDSYYASISPSGIYCMGGGSPVEFLRISSTGIELSGGQGTSGYAFTTNGETAHIPTETSQLTNDSNFIAANRVSDTYFGLTKDLKIYSEDSGNITTVSHTGINFETDINDVDVNQDGFFVSRDSDGAHLCSFTPTGIRFADKTDKDIPTADGTFISVNDLASADDVSSLRAGLSRKQDKITVNEVDTTDIETADITKLITIVTNLIDALNESGLIRETKTLE